MNDIDLTQITVGDTLPELVLPPVNRTMLALYAGASNDHNPIHIDLDFARKGGMPDVFAHGMLSMAWLGRLLTQWVDQHRLRAFEVRFAAITQLGEGIRCSGTVVERTVVDGETRLVIDLQTTNPQGQPRIVGRAVVAA